MKYFWLALTSFLIPFNLFAQATTPELFVDIWRHQRMRNDQYQQDPRMEVYMRLLPTSLNFVTQVDGSSRANVSLRVELRQKSNGARIKSESWELSAMQDKQGVPLEDSEDLIKIMPLTLAPGGYELKVSARDLNVPGGSWAVVEREFEMPNPLGARTGFSDISFVKRDPRKYRKRNRLQSEKSPSEGGYFEPLVSNSSFVNDDSLFVYIQLYNVEQLIDKDEFSVRATVNQSKQQIAVMEYEKTDNTTRNFNLFIHAFDIRRLPSNHYYVAIELLDPTNGRVLLSSSRKIYILNSRGDSEFQRYVEDVYPGDIFNGYSEEELDYYISTLKPLSTAQEIGYGEVLRSLQQKKNFLYTFWTKRRQEQWSVVDLWRGHIATIDYVNSRFRGETQQGWQSDRGRVFITYGPPTDIQPLNREGNPIHEVWIYDRLEAQRNVIFVFYNPQFPEGNYTLVHSDKYGEVSDERWANQVELPE